LLNEIANGNATELKWKRSEIEKIAKKSEKKLK
jgi:hypothetical protein